MENNTKSKSEITRRKFLPFLSLGFLLPYVGLAKTTKSLIKDEEQSYQTLLTKDGKAVKVKKTAIEKSKVIDSELSNKSLLKWLSKNKFNSTQQ